MSKKVLLISSMALLALLLSVLLFGPAVTPAPAQGQEPVWPTEVQADPINECVDCRCPAVHDDSKFTQEHVFENTRGYRYMEVFVQCPGQQAGIYNTTALNILPSNGRDSAPDVLMNDYSDKQVVQDYGAVFSYMSGIREWTHDKMRVGLGNNVRNLDGLDTRWGADYAIPEGLDMSKGEQLYVINYITCNRTWYYEKGKPVYLLDTPDGWTFVMQSFTTIVDPTQTQENLAQLGDRLKNLPEGWKFRTKILDQDLTVNGITSEGLENQWRVTQDEFVNTYSACWTSETGESSCNYMP